MSDFSDVNVFDSIKWSGDLPRDAQMVIDEELAAPKSCAGAGSSASSSKKRREGDLEPFPPSKRQQLTPPATRATTPVDLFSAVRLALPEATSDDLTVVSFDSISTASQSCDRLTSLPYELRHKIWKYVLTGGDIYCCKDYGYLDAVGTIKREKINNGADVMIHQNCPWRTFRCRSHPACDNRLILLNKQTYSDTKDILPKMAPYHLIFGHPQCLMDFESVLRARDRKHLTQLTVLTVFKAPPYKGIAAEGKKAMRTKRQFKRLENQAGIWQRHTQNRVQYIAKKVAGPLNRETYDAYPKIVTVNDFCVAKEGSAEVYVKVSKELVYPGKQQLLIADVEEKVDEEGG